MGNYIPQIVLNRCHHHKIISKKNIPDENKLFLIKSLANNEIQFQLMNEKGYFPYEWFDSIDKLKLPITELKKEDFNNR